MSTGADPALRHGTVPGNGQAHLRLGERVRGHLYPARPAAPQPRRGGPLPVPPGGQLGPLVQRVPGERGPPLPRRRQPSRVRHARVRRHRRAGGPRQGGGVDPVVAGRGGRGPHARGGHPGRHLPLQEQHRLGRQLLRLPRELPDQPPRRLHPLHRGADPVPGEPPGLRRGRQGAPDGPGRGVLPEPAGRAHLGGRVVGHHPEPAHHQHPRRAARRRREVPPAARHRRRLQHERVRHVPEDRRRPASSCGCSRTRRPSCAT